MKRYFAIILCLVLVFLLWGCTTPTEDLTKEELRWFSEEFFSDISEMNDESKDLNIRNMFLKCEFDSPKNIDFEILFREGLHKDDSVSQEEIDLYNETTGNKISLNYNKVTQEDMNAIFQANTGLLPSQTARVGIEKLVYLEKYDAYYHCHGGIYYGYCDIQSGERTTNGTVKLYYRALQTGPCPLWCVTLKPAGDTYHFVSNLPTGEELPPFP